MVVNSISQKRYCESVFLVELHSRIKFLPVKSTAGNDCISIDMRCCSEDFLIATDGFLAKSIESIRLLVTGSDYDLEVLNSDVFERTTGWHFFSRQKGRMKKEAQYAGVKIRQIKV